MEATDKGIMQFISDNEPVEDKESKEMSALIDKLFPRPRQKPMKPEIYLMGDDAKRYHGVLGDKGFREMLNNVQIVTNTEGCDYIENFMKED